MSEIDYFPTRGGKFRTSRYPGFVGGSEDATTGNFVPGLRVSNPNPLTGEKAASLGAPATPAAEEIPPVSFSTTPLGTINSVSGTGGGVDEFGYEGKPGALTQGEENLARWGGRVGGLAFGLPGALVAAGVTGVLNAKNVLKADEKLRARGFDPLTPTEKVLGTLGLNRFGRGGVIGEPSDFGLTPEAAKGEMKAPEVTKDTLAPPPGTLEVPTPDKPSVSLAPDANVTGVPESEAEAAKEGSISRGYEDQAMAASTGGGVGETSGVGCFVTTAVAGIHGWPDDCRTLALLRAFRDRWLAHRPGGRAQIAAYYRIAPGIVATIDARPDAGAVYGWLWRRYIRRAVAAVAAGKPRRAWRIYVRMMSALCRQEKPR